MIKKYAKKTIILYILKILEEYPENNKPLSYTLIAKVLNSYNIQCDRKTVSRNINYLIDFGCPIIKGKAGVCYLNKKDYRPLLKDVDLKDKSL